MMILCLYALALMGLGFMNARRGNSPASFFINNRGAGAGSVALSVVASCVGGSATLGMAGLAWQVGAPAFWWMGSGACGLVILTVFLARKVRRSGAFTLPEMVEASLGPAARRLVACIILLAWPAVLAAQFLAMGKIMAMLSGFAPDVAMVAGAVLLVGYAALGGQAAVIRSDVIQFVVIAFGLLLALIFLGRINPTPLTTLTVEPLNAVFPADRLLQYLVVLGGSYVVCPMLFGRFLSARDEQSALRGGWIAVAGLVATAVLIVLLGVACRGLVPADTMPDDVLVRALVQLPSVVGVMLLVALFSAVVSSADSCLLTAATVCCNDVLRLRSARACRAVLPVVGMAGLALALGGGDILRFLLMANDVYVCGVVAPVFVGLLAYPRFPIRRGWALVSVGVGGLLGLSSAVSGNHLLSYAGFGLSAMLCLYGAFSLPGQRQESRAVLFPPRPQ